MHAYGNAPRISRRKELFVCLAAALGLASSVASSRGRDEKSVHSPLAPTVHHVTTCADDNSAGSLRSIIANAGTVSGDIIDFSQLPMACSTITLAPGNGALAVTQSALTISGPGAESLTIDGQYLSSVLLHGGAGTLAISGITIANGAYTGAIFPAGGCIYSAGNVYLSHTVVSSCSVTGTSVFFAHGGGVYTKGYLKLDASTIKNSEAKATNGADASGGGAYAVGDFTSRYSTISGNSASASLGNRSAGGGVKTLGNATIVSSTISDNSAGYSGGLEFWGAAPNTASIVNSTISSNVGVFSTGGIYSTIPLTVSNSTIAFNSSEYELLGFSEGISIYNAPLTLHSTIISGNSTPNGENDVGGYGIAAIIDGAKNIVVSSTLPLPAGTLQTFQNCPRLDVLQDNGGPTRTHALPPASVAIDQGDNNAMLTEDQRQMPRPAGADVDIGAFELQPTVDHTERLLAGGFDNVCDQ